MNPKKVEVEVEVDMYFDIWKNSRIIENPMYFFFVGGGLILVNDPWIDIPAKRNMFLWNFDKFLLLNFSALVVLKNKEIGVFGVLVLKSQKCIFCFLIPEFKENICLD